MKKNIIIIVSIVSALSIIVGLGIYFWGNKSPVYFWRVVPVEKGELNVIVTATGTLAADTSVDVGVQVSGIIAKIKVDFNAVVKKGQVIAILDTTLYYAAKLDAFAAYQRAQVALAESKREYIRSKNLLANKVAAQADYDVAMTAYRNAQGNLTSLKAQYDKANINLQYCTITAPISGMVVSRNVQVGNMVIASFNSPILFTIAYDLTKMQVQADVDEADIGQVELGQKAKFTVDAYPNDVFDGVVTQIRHQPVMVQNVVNYVVIIEVPNPKLKLMPGLTANSNIFIKDRKNVLKVPTNAFTFVPPLEYIQASKLLSPVEKKFWIASLRQTSELKKQQIVESNGAVGNLWVKRGKDIIPKSVKKGLNDGSFTEVGGNIAEGEEVVTGINHTATASDAGTSKSPFMPKFPSGKK
jgi:HlyD family secretion protein